MKNYIALEKILKKIIKLNKTIELIKWNYDTSFASMNIKGKAEELCFLLSIKHEMMSDPLVGNLLNAVNVDELSDEQKNVFSTINLEYENNKFFNQELNEAIIISTIKCKKASLLAIEKDNFTILIPELEKLFSNVRENLAIKANDNCSNYDVILKCIDTSTEYVDDVCRKIGSTLKGKEFVCEENQSIDFTTVEEIINIFLLKIGAGQIKYYPGFFNEVMDAIEDIKLVINKNSKNPLLDFFYELGKALYVLYTSKENHYTLNEVALEGCGYLFSRLLIPNDNIITKIKKIFKKQESQNVICDYVNHININFDFMYKVAEYSVEKGLLNGEFKIKDLPDVWDEQMQYYLNIDQKQSSNLLLQNSNWCCNKFGNSAHSILGMVFSCQSFSEFITKDTKILKSHYYHPLKELEKIFFKIMKQDLQLFPLETQFDTKYYFDFA